MSAQTSTPHTQSLLTSHYTYTLAAQVPWLGEPPRQVRPWPDQYFDFVYKFDR